MNVPLAFLGCFRRDSLYRTKSCLVWGLLPPMSSIMVRDERRLESMLNIFLAAQRKEKKRTFVYSPSLLRCAAYRLCSRPFSTVEATTQQCARRNMSLDCVQSRLRPIHHWISFSLLCVCFRLGYPISFVQLGDCWFPGHCLPLNAAQILNIHIG